MGQDKTNASRILVDQILEETKISALGDTSAEAFVDDELLKELDRLEVKKQMDDLGPVKTVSIDKSQPFSLAQKKIVSLEEEVDRLRLENHKMLDAAESYLRQNNDLNQQLKNAHIVNEESSSIYEEEKRILNEAISSRDLKVNALREHIKSLEYQLESNFSQLRERERELENRLEILQYENKIISKNKDQMILKIKEEMNQKNKEIDQLNKLIMDQKGYSQDKEESLNRTIKTLRLTLTMLESSDNSDDN